MERADWGAHQRDRDGSRSRWLTAAAAWIGEEGCEDGLYGDFSDTLAGEDLMVETDAERMYVKLQKRQGRTDQPRVVRPGCSRTDRSCTSRTSGSTVE